MSFSFFRSPINIKAGAIVLLFNLQLFTLELADMDLAFECVRETEAVFDVATSQAISLIRIIVSELEERKLGPFDKDKVDHGKAADLNKCRVDFVKNIFTIVAHESPTDFIDKKVHETIESGNVPKIHDEGATVNLLISYIKSKYYVHVIELFTQSNTELTVDKKIIIDMDPGKIIYVARMKTKTNENRYVKVSKFEKH